MDDLQLVEACLRHDAAAQTALVRRHRRMVRQVLARHGLKPDDVADVEQQMWLRLLMGNDNVPPALGAYRGVGPLTAWLRTCAAREALTFRRKYAARPRNCHLIDDHLAAAPDPECEVLRREAGSVFAAAFCEAVATLDEDDRRLLREHAVDCVGIGELAAHRGMHRTTVMRRLSKIKSRLRRRTNWALGEHFGRRLAPHWSATDLRLGPVLRG